VKITTYNEHRSASFFRALVVKRYRVYSGQGAGNFIQSAETSKPETTTKALRDRAS
jgi:hypothetical protein